MPRDLPEAHTLAMQQRGSVQPQGQGPDAGDAWRELKRASRARYWVQPGSANMTWPWPAVLKGVLRGISGRMFERRGPKNSGWQRPGSIDVPELAAPFAVACSQQGDRVGCDDARCERLERS